MASPRVGAVSITDASGVHYMACPGCDTTGCVACGGAGRIRTFPLIPAPSYLPGTYVPATAVGHVNHVAPATPADLIRAFTRNMNGPEVGAVSIRSKDGTLIDLDAAFEAPSLFL